MRKLIAICTLGAACVATAAVARVAPLSPEAKLMLDRQFALENAFRARFSDGSFNRFRDMYGSIIVAEERNGRPTLPRALFKDEAGWHELVGAGRRAVPRRVAHELDRLMVTGDLWRETAYVQDAPCAEPRVYVLRYGGNERYGRQCGAPGLAGRLAEVAATFRVPAGQAVTTAPPDPDSIGPLEDLTSHIGARVREMLYAWERRSLAGAVDPYAEDAIIEFADGRVLRGRKALAEWMRPQQDWLAPGLASQGIIKGIRYERGVIKAPEGDIITELREIRWQENGRPLRRTYSANWRNNEGLWQIVHERVSEDKPVTDERIAW